MELIDVIVSAVKIFSIVATTIILVSYLVFKLKSKKRNQKYLTPIIAEPEQFIAYEVPQIPVEMEQEEELPGYRNIRERFQVINESEPVRMEQQFNNDSFYYPKSQSFSNVNNYKSISSNKIYSRHNEKYSSPSSNKKGAIYNLYSLTASESMHKLKVN
jgi:hypothetical protein